MVVRGRVQTDFQEPFSNPGVPLVGQLLSPVVGVLDEGLGRIGQVNVGVVNLELLQCLFEAEYGGDQVGVLRIFKFQRVAERDDLDVARQLASAAIVVEKVARDPLPATVEMNLGHLAPQVQVASEDVTAPGGPTKPLAELKGAGQIRELAGRVGQLAVMGREDTVAVELGDGHRSVVPPLCRATGTVRYGSPAWDGGLPGRERFRQWWRKVHKAFA